MQTNAAWSPDGSKIATSGRDHVIRIWDTATQGLLIALEGHSSRVYSVSWSPDSTRLASVDGANLFVWEVATGVATSDLSQDGAFSVAWSPHGHLCAVGRRVL